MHRLPSASIPTIRQPLAGRVALAVLIAVSAVAAHQVTYLLGFGGDGFGRAIGAGGHDGYWAPFVALVLLAATILALVTVRQLRRLSAHAAHLGSGSHPSGELRGFLWAAAVLWFRLGVATTIVYAVQENVERVLVGLGPSGLDALAAHGLLPIIVVLVASLVVATVAALVRWRCEVLRARLARDGAQPRRRKPASARPPRSMRVPLASTPAARGSRAPPAVALAV